MVNPQVAKFMRDLTVTMVYVPLFIPLPCLHSVRLTKGKEKRKGKDPCHTKWVEGRGRKSQEDLVQDYF